MVDLNDGMDMDRMDDLMDEYGEMEDYYDEDIDGSDSQSPGQQFYN
jgi:hypothetical protein